jgi:hypothetical protein
MKLLIMQPFVRYYKKGVHSNRRRKLPVIVKGVHWFLLYLTTKHVWSTVNANIMTLFNRIT